MSEINDVVPGEPVESDWGNEIRDRAIQRYADSSDPNIPAVPISGDPRWLIAESEFSIYDGAEWSAYAVLDADVTFDNVAALLSVSVGSVDATDPVMRPGGGVTYGFRTGAGLSTGMAFNTFPFLELLTNGTVVAQFRATSTFLPVAGGSTIGNAPNAYLRASDGFLAVSTALLAVLDGAALTAINSRVGTSETEHVDLEGLVTHILDRLDALEI